MKYVIIILLFLIFQQSFSNEKLNADSLEKRLFEMIAKKEFNDTLRDIVNYLTYYHRNRDPEKAVEFFYRLQRVMLENAPGNYIASSLAGLAGVYYDQGLFDKALEYNFKILLLVPDTADQIYVAWHYVDIGNIYYHNNMYDEAIKYYQISAEIFLKALNTTLPNAERFKEYNHAMAVNYNNIGLAYEEMNDLYNALENHKIALKYREASGRSQGTAYGYSYLSKLYFKLGNDSLFNYYKQKAFETLFNQEAKSFDYQIGLAEHYLEFGKIAVLQKNYKEAKEYFDSAIELFTQIDDNKDIIKTYFEYADLELAQKNYSAAEKLFFKALNIAEKLNYYKFRTGGLLELSKFYKATNRIDKAYDYLRRYTEVTDSLTLLYMKFSLRNVQNELELNKQIQKIALLEKDNQITNLQLRRRSGLVIFLIVGIILIAIIAFVIFLNFVNRKKAAKIIEQKNQELEEKNKLLDKQAKHFEELSSTKDKFFSIIAHDLKNPLSAFYRLSETLYEAYDEFSEEERRSLLNDMMKSSKNVFDLLQNLLTWSRSQRNKIEINPVEVDLHFIVENIYQIFKQIADNKSIDLIIYCDRDIKLNIDVNILQTILRNLVSNALKFTPSGGRVEIGAEKNNSNVIIYVKDTGVGIPEDKIGELFRVDKTYTTPGTNNESGTGLGLIICKEFLEKCGGKVDVESQLSKGTTFKIILPIDKKQ